MRNEGVTLARALWRALLVAAALVVFNCQSAREDPSGGETHFLERCREGESSCGSDLVCTCGVCTLPCAAPATCGRFAGASCVAATAAQQCAASNANFCDVECASHADCAEISSEHRCEAGACRRGAVDTQCPAGEPTVGSDVVILGDSFFAADHSVTAFLEDIARTRGALAAGQRYRDYSTVLGNTLALLGSGIADQYAAALAESAVPVVIMTGGGADVLVGSCDVLSAECPLLTAAAAAAGELLARMAGDGVEHVVFVFYPDPTDDELRAEVSALRPLLESACAASPVPCAWVDLRPTFSGREATYLNAEGTTPTAEGAQATAASIWSAMSAACIAQ